MFAAVFGDLVRAPRRVPHPVDADVVDQATADQRAARLILDDIGQRARRRREGHVDQRDGPFVTVLHVQAVDQAQVNDVDPQLRVDDVAHRLLDVGEQFLSRCAGFAHL
ncbi:Uncharacterised protein [Mycobacterium tuberculosis]|nr:Uncharacterised protein [Mycobacterium tuberculosis]